MTIKSLCCTTHPCCLSILYMAVRIYSINFLENFSSILNANKNIQIYYICIIILPPRYVRFKLKQLYNYKSLKVVKLKHTYISCQL